MFLTACLLLDEVFPQHVIWIMLVIWKVGGGHLFYYFWRP